MASPVRRPWLDSYIRRNAQDMVVLVDAYEYAIREYAPATWLSLRFDTQLAGKAVGCMRHDKPRGFLRHNDE